MRFVIVTGMSGAGKATALKTLEDAGFFCVDNLPIQLIRRFAEIAYDAEIQVDDVAIYEAEGRFHSSIHVWLRLHVRV